MDPLTGSAGHGFITFGVFRYVLGHKALDPVAGIRAAVEKRRHRSTDVRSTARRATATSHATLRGRPNLARLRDRLKRDEVKWNRFGIPKSGRFLIHRAGWVGGQHGWASLILRIFGIRVVAAVESGGLSCNQAAKQFGVAISTAIGWVRRLRQTGSVAPGKMGGHRPKAISGEHRVWLLQRIKRDFTLRGLVAELAERGLKVDYRSVWEFVHAEKLSFKKKRGGWRTPSSRRRQTTSPVDQISRSRRT